MDNSNGNSNARGEIFSRCVHAGRRTYYLDVRETKSGKDCYVTIKERKKEGDAMQSHTVYLYKEDFERFLAALDEVVDFAQKKLQEAAP